MSSNDYGKVTFKGKEYTLTEQAYTDNIGTDGEVCYFAHATNGEVDENRELIQYKIMWELTDDWQEQSKIFQKLNDKKCNAEQWDGELLTEEELDQFIEVEVYIQDNERAGDWDNPVEAWEV